MMRILGLEAEEEFRHKLGTLLEIARKDAGISQVELAKRLGVTQQTVSKHEHGHVQTSIWLGVKWMKACRGDLRGFLMVGEEMA